MTTTTTLSSPNAVQKTCEEWRSSGLSVGFVPTMGCLHEGHLSLIREARKRCDRVVTSIFVNPLQFGKNEDFSTYPRQFARDLEHCRNLGVDLVFHPDASEIYSPHFNIRMDSGPIGKLYCGASRPGFFDGVLTVVAILLNITRPTCAFFGEKDFQQLFLIKRLAQDFYFPTEIVGMPIIREANGLAMSSRNEYLTQEQRDIALCLSRALKLVQTEFKNGDTNALSLTEKAQHLFLHNSLFALDYLHVIDEKTLAKVTGKIDNPCRVLIAGYIGDNPRIRLIDNGRLT